MRQRAIFQGVAGAALLLVSAAVASAQQPQGQAPTSGGPLVVQQLDNGFVIAPDVKFTTFNGYYGTIVGAYGGYLNDNRFLIGGAGYGLVNGRNGSGLGYGGLVLGWTMDPTRSVSADVRGLLGFGEATSVYQTVTVLPPVVAPFDGNDNRRNTTPVPPVPAVPVTSQVHFHTGVFVAEPQVDLHLKLTDVVRVTLGAGYRAIANGYYNRYYYGGYYGYSVPNYSHDLSGATGSVSVQFFLR
jgi:hypothetical protein